MSWGYQSSSICMQILVFKWLQKAGGVTSHVFDRDEVPGRRGHGSGVSPNVWLLFLLLPFFLIPWLLPPQPAVFLVFVRHALFQKSLCACSRCSCSQPLCIRHAVPSAHSLAQQPRGAGLPLPVSQ